MASEQVLEVLVRRHVFDTDRPFAAVLDGIFGGITQPGVGQAPMQYLTSWRMTLARDYLCTGQPTLAPGPYTLSGHEPCWIAAGGRGSRVDTQRPW